MATNALHAVCDNLKRDSQPTDPGFDGKILAHHAKAGYDYPTIHLPFVFSGLIGLSTRIYQTVQDGALAFLVVVSSAATEKSADRSKNPLPRSKTPALTWRRSCVQIASSPSFFLQSDVLELSDELEPSIRPLLDMRILAKKNI